MRVQPLGRGTQVGEELGVAEFLAARDDRIGHVLPDDGDEEPVTVSPRPSKRAGILIAKVSYPRPASQGTSDSSVYSTVTVGSPASVKRGGSSSRSASAELSKRSVSDLMEASPPLGSQPGSVWRGPGSGPNATGMRYV